MKYMIMTFGDETAASVVLGCADPISADSIGLKPIDQAALQSLAPHPRRR